LLVFCGSVFNRIENSFKKNHLEVFCHVSKIYLFASTTFETNYVASFFQKDKNNVFLLEKE